MGKVEIKNALVVYADEYFFQDKSFKLNEQLYYDNKLEEIVDYLSPFTYRDNNNFISKNNLKRATKEFFEAYLPLKDIPTVINGEVVFTSPLNAMVDYQYKYSGGLVNNNPATIDGVERKITLVISLKEKPILISIPIYAHELTHTQVEKNVGTLENYFNREVLSIFIEKVCSFHFRKDMFDEMELFRLCDLKYCLDHYMNYKDKHMTDRYKNRSYVDGTFKASHLFYIYLNGNSYLRKEMLKDVGKVFNEEITVEEFLRFYGITLENSKDIKYLKRKH